MKSRPKYLTFAVYALLLLIGVYAMYAVLHRQSQTELRYSDVRNLFLQEKVDSFTVKDSVLRLQLKEKYQGETEVEYVLPSFSVFYNDLNDTVREQYQKGTLRAYDYQPDSKTPWFVTMLPYLLVLGGMAVLMIWMTNRASGTGMASKFGRANTRVATSDRRVSFADVAGADEEKAELQEVVDFLRNPQKYRKLGAQIPKGILLVGPPGTGKTLLARAVAGEADVDFLSISGSDFVELYVGVGASRVRDLFDQAKRLAPSIIFIDEIDAVGRKRGAGLGGGHDEREQTLNQLLVEMDGFSKNEGVIVIAATNRSDILDDALLRPGRFDRQIYVAPPDTKGREAILRIHARGKPLSDDVRLSVIAKATAGFTGADLENLLNEAALLAARNERPVICMADMEEAILKILAGPEKKSHTVSQYDKRLTAVHEAGHAVAMYHLPTHDPVHRISIIPRGKTGGMTISLPLTDSDYSSKKEMFETIVALLGGRIAEQLYMDDISTGASNDLQRATGIARDMVARYGMSARIGSVSFDSEGEIFIGRDYEKTKAYSEKTAGVIDEEVKAILDEASDRCTRILGESREKLLCVVDYLVAHGSMNRAQFEACMKGEAVIDEEENLFDAFLDSEKAAESHD